jgi:hypothetical protein
MARSISQIQSDRRAAKQRRSQVLEALADVITRPYNDGFSEPLLRAALFSSAIGLDDLVRETAARGTHASKNCRDEALLSLAILAIQKLLE